MNFIVILAILFLISSTSASAPCVGGVSLIPRGGSGSTWNDEDNSFQIFDISMGNSGSCAIDSLTFQFTFSSSSIITSYWNMIQVGSTWVINSTSLNRDGSSILAAGSSDSVSVGFVVKSPLNMGQIAASVRVLKTECRRCSPVSPSTPPTASTAPTATPTPTPLPSATPTSLPTDTCAATATLVKRESANWNDGVHNFQIYDISLLNTGSCELDSVGLQFEFSGDAHIESAWNIMDDGTYWMLGSSTISAQSVLFLESGDSTDDIAGFVLKYPINVNYQLSASIRVYGVACPASCTA